MWHSFIQVAVDIYGHLLPEVSVACVHQDSETSPQKSATPRNKLAPNRRRGPMASRAKLLK